jgi:hypothetical protein
MLSIATVSHAATDRGDLWRSEGLYEVGAGGGWSVNLKIESEQRFADHNETATGWRAGVQKSFGIGERGSIAIIASYIGGDSMDGPYCTGDGGEVRGAAGTSFQIAGREAFVNAEVGYRARDAVGCSRSLAEVAFGMEVAPKVRTIVKSWVEDGGEGQSAKLEASLMYDFSFATVGLGWREEVSGDFKESGWLISTWKTF